MNDYKPNTDRFREEEKNKVAQKDQHVEKVTSGKTRTRKRSKWTDIFNELKEYAVSDVIVPTLKKTLSELVTSGTDMILYDGEIRHRKRSTRSNRPSYREYYDDRNGRDYYSYRNRSAYNYEDVILENRGEAELVLDRMMEIIDKYDRVSINDLYDLVGYDGGRYTDANYGWTNLRNADVRRTRDGGYLLDLPPAKPID